MQSLGQVVLQLDDIISSEGEEERVYVCIRENCERHDDLCEGSTVDCLHAARYFTGRSTQNKPPKV